MPFATGRRSRWGAPSSSSEDEQYDVEKVNRQIDNARMRIADSGFDADTGGDKRNWFEKSTNLPEGQNWFFDALEILSRPSQAVLSMVDNVQKKEGDLGTAAWQGFSGQERTRGSDIVENAGIDNKLAKAVLGTAIEIGADPLTFVPGGVIAKGVGAAAKSAGRGVMKGYEAAESAIPVLGRVSEKYIRPGAESTKDALGYMFNRDYKLDETLDGSADDTIKRLAQDAENKRRYMQEESLKGVADAAKSAGGIETGVDVGRVMEAPLRQFEDVKMYELPDGIRRTTSKRELKNETVANKQRIKELGTQVRESRKDLDSQISESARHLDKLDHEIRRMFDYVERRKLKNLQKTDPSTLAGKTPLRGFMPNSPSLNLLMKQGEELKVQIEDMRSELGLPKVRKRSYSHEQMEKMATDRAFKQLSPSPAFNVLLKQRDELKESLDELRELRKSAGQDEISEIQKLTDEISAIKESAKNPVMVQREIARPKRDLPDSPAINQAAQELISKNQDLRDYARDNGIEIPELEGYMTHVLSAAEREFRKRQGKSGRVTPSNEASKSILKNRELEGSAEDVNERIGRDFFEPNAYFATAIGQKRLIDYIQAVDFRRKVLSNPNFSQRIKEGEKVIPGKNQEIIDMAEYKFIKEGDDILEGAGLAEEIGGKYLVTKAVKNALDRYQKLNTDEGTKAFMKAFDATQNTWKKLALFSPGYHIRNFAGGMFNNYVGGMNTANLAKYTGQAAKEVTDAAKGKESDLFNEYRRQGLGSTGLSQVEFLRSTDPEKAIEKTITDRSSDTPIRDRLNPLRAFETSREAGDFIDQVNRFALYKWARDKGMTPEQAAGKVREVQYDYTNLSQFEQKATRLIPFYRWMRNNIPFQIVNFINDPRKYANVNKIRLNAQDAVGIDEETQPDYMKENFSIPVYGDGDGTGKMLGLNLPLSDLPKLSDPLKVLLDALTPLGKLPAELALNRSFFYDKPIQEFAGQEKQFALPENILGLQIPGGGAEAPSVIEPNARLAYLIEQLGGQPVRTLSNLFTAPTSEDQAKKFKDPVFGINSILKDFDVNRAEYFEQREQLQQLLDLIKYIEQQTGQEVRTVNEIR